MMQLKVNFHKKTEDLLNNGKDCFYSIEILKIKVGCHHQKGSLICQLYNKRAILLNKL